MSMRLRLALSSDALLHVGSARIALGNWLLARKLGGHLVLRLDATAPDREATPHAALRDDLHWLGLDWDDEARQAERGARYQAAAERLKASGRLYPCFESEHELAAKRERRIRQGKPPTYDRAMLKLTPAQRAGAEAGGKRPYWRFRLSDRVLTWTDLTQGRMQEALPAVSDPVMLRADDTPATAFAGAVDDLEDGITHILRGADQASLSAVQADLRAALGGDPDGIATAHLPALADSGGERLSRRAGNFTLRGLRQQGVAPAALAAYLAGLGAAEAAHPAMPADLVAGFDPAGFGRDAPRFDLRRLLAVNRQELAALPFNAVADRLPTGATEAFWHAVRGSIDLLTEARGFWDVVAGNIVPPIIEGEAAFLRTALEMLPPEPWDALVWTTWAAALKDCTGRSGRDLTVPLRLALTGEEQGPDLRALLPLIGRPRAAHRLAVAAS